MKVTLVGTDVLKIEYVAVGDIASIRWPTPALPQRVDGLWRHSCFEAFVPLGTGPGYVEYNFAPSRHWAAYRFERYREGMEPALDLMKPDIFVEASDARFELTAWLDLKPLGMAVPRALGLSAVIEEIDGTKSYWALAHPNPDEPDFHDLACFTLELPPPRTP